MAQPKSTINLRRIMDEGRVLVVNLSKGALGEGTSHLLGALLTTALATAALSRSDTPEHRRRPFYLYADEFQNYASNGFAVILSEARKYALSLTLGHQYLGQLPDNLRQAVLGQRSIVRRLPGRCRGCPSRRYVPDEKDIVAPRGTLRVGETSITP